MQIASNSAPIHELWSWKKEKKESDLLIFFFFPWPAGSRLAPGCFLYIESLIPLPLPSFHLLIQVLFVCFIFFRLHLIRNRECEARLLDWRAASGGWIVHCEGWTEYSERGQGGESEQDM